MKNNIVYNSLTRWAAGPKHDAIVYDGQVRDWAQFKSSCLSTAHYLWNRGIRCRDAVTFIADDGVKWLEVFHALTVIGAVPVVVMPNAGRDYVVSISQRAASRWIITQKNMLDDLEIPPGLPTVLMDDINDQTELDIDLVYDYTEQDVWAVITSSGTTSDPKLIAHRHHGLEQTFSKPNPLALDHTSRVMTSVKLASSFGMIISILGHLSLGYTLIVLDTPRDFRRIHDIIDEQGVTNAMVSPKIIDFLVRHKIGDFHPGLQAVYSTGEALLPMTESAFREKFGRDVLNTYGAGEIRTWAVLSNSPGDFRRGSLGRMGPGAKCLLTRDDGSVCDVDEIGELVVYHSNIAVGYVGDAVRTQRSFVDGGYRTGDYMWMDSDGYYYYAGRREQLMEHQGRWISCLELENRINQQPGVTDSVVIRVDQGLAAFVLGDVSNISQVSGIDSIYSVVDIPITDTNKKSRSFDVLKKYVVST
jgi:acyl-coenzyme A synthetase/AMP-(fatty) acid ligase